MQMYASICDGMHVLTYNRHVDAIVFIYIYIFFKFLIFMEGVLQLVLVFRLDLQQKFAQKFAFWHELANERGEKGKQTSQKQA